MIKYTLQCDQAHRFESWFQDSAAYEKLVNARMVACTTCGSNAVTKSLMAPAVVQKGEIVAPKPPLEKLRDHVEANSDYVGLSFAQEARDMHDGLIPERAIYGEANAKDAKKLIDDGIPVMPLPFIPRKKVN